MRYAILADIHANIEAFTAVLTDIAGRHVDKVWCLGDIVDYGPDPHTCIVLLQRQRHLTVCGNHDLAAIGVLGTSDFHPDAAAANNWTRQQLGQADLDFLASLPADLVQKDFTLVHGSPRDMTWEYLRSADVAAENLAYLKSPYCFVGHTHKPAIFLCRETGCGALDFPAEADFRLDKNRLFINPGAVGQPRDGDPRASYVVLDDEARTIRLYRVPYDIAATQAKMLKAGLPSNLIARLSYGM